MDRRGIALMFIGAIFIGILMFTNLPISFTVWAILFVITLVISATGTVMCIISLSKSIKADYKEKKE